MVFSLHFKKKYLVKKVSDLFFYTHVCICRSLDLKYYKINKSVPFNSFNFPLIFRNRVEV